MNHCAPKTLAQSSPIKHFYADRASIIQPFSAALSCFFDPEISAEIMTYFACHFFAGHPRGTSLTIQKKYSSAAYAALCKFTNNHTLFYFALLIYFIFDQLHDSAEVSLHRIFIHSNLPRF